MKRTCLLACLGLACSGGERLIPTEMDASVMDSMPEETPSFTVIAPVDGDVYAGSTVTVTGTAKHLDAIAIAGQSVAVIEGAFTRAIELEEGRHTIMVSAPGAGEVSISVIVDLTPPVLEILSPPRGAFLESTSSVIRVEGRATDAVSGIDEVR